MSLRTLDRELIEIDFPDSEVSRSEFDRNYVGLVRGNVRLSTGLFYTEDEWNSHKRQALAISLPGSRKPSFINRIYHILTSYFR